MLRLARMTLRGAAALVPYPAARPSVVAPAAVACMSSSVESFLNGSTSVYADEMYRAWVKDPSR
jgi:hypothetical protein